MLACLRVETGNFLDAHELVVAHAQAGITGPVVVVGDLRIGNGATGVRGYAEGLVEGERANGGLFVPLFGLAQPVFTYIALRCQQRAPRALIVTLVHANARRSLANPCHDEQLPGILRGRQLGNPQGSVAKLIAVNLPACSCGFPAPSSTRALIARCSVLARTTTASQRKGKRSHAGERHDRQPPYGSSFRAIDTQFLYLRRIQQGLSVYPNTLSRCSLASLECNNQHGDSNARGNGQLSSATSQ